MPSDPIYPFDLKCKSLFANSLDLAECESPGASESTSHISSSRKTVQRAHHGRIGPPTFLNRETRPPTEPTIL
jgi:hypothetical protein